MGNIQNSPTIVQTLELSVQYYDLQCQYIWGAFVIVVPPYDFHPVQAVYEIVLNACIQGDVTLSTMVYILFCLQSKYTRGRCPDAITMQQEA